jgi:hypothetical protein
MTKTLIDKQKVNRKCEYLMYLVIGYLKGVYFIICGKMKLMKRKPVLRYTELKPSKIGEITYLLCYGIQKQKPNMFQRSKTQDFEGKEGLDGSSHKTHGNNLKIKGNSTNYGKSEV